MAPLDEALAQISDIRAHLARSQIFRGYRSTIVGFSAVVALAAAGLQAVFLPMPERAMRAYLFLWIGAAVLNLSVAAAEISMRCLRTLSPLSVRQTWLAVEQFLPCLAVGALLTVVLVRHESQNLWMLPGVWSIVFSLGVFASWRLLPRPAFWVAVWYFAAGTVCLALARGDASLSPWAMVGTFGVGQTLATAILYTTERTHGSL